MERKTSGLVYQDMLWEVVRAVRKAAPNDGMPCARAGIEKAKLFFEELLHFCSVEVHE